jgi:uncharacterized repeat protein (TIGR02543 family)
MKASKLTAWGKNFLLPRLQAKQVLPLPLLLLTLAPLRAAEPPQITKQPVGGTSAKQASVRFYLSAASTDGGYLTYQWYRSGKFNAPVGNPNGVGKITILANSPTPTGTSATLTTTAPATAGYYYYWVVITNHKDGETAATESAIVEMEVVNKLLPSHIVLGDFENFEGPVGVNAISNYWPLNKYQFAWNSTVNEYRGIDRGQPSQGVGKMFDLQPHNVWRSGLTGGQYGTYSIEIAPFRAASAYQEIATVSGKIYEWSFDHACRNPNLTPDIMALIIGPAINGAGDYGRYEKRETNYWNKVNASTSPTTFTTSWPERETDYPYGVNNHVAPEGQDTYFLAILNKMMSDNGLTTSTLYLLANNSVGFTTSYYGKIYYVYIALTAYSEAWRKKSGVYTIPSGQGTTVYAWLDVTQHDGNIVDNIVFASGASIASRQEVSYASEAQLSVATKAGYAYGIAEIRGSTANSISDAPAYYDADGAGAAQKEQPITANNDGWYISASFAGSGVITFKNLTPGKLYRVVGIPAAAISAALHVNERPSYVLDEGYYKDTRILPVGAGDASMVWGIGVEVVNGKARITVKNARSDVEYALLDSAGGGVALAHVWTDWAAGAGGKASFDNLTLDTTYYLVSRPLGYSEVTYAEAAEVAIAIRTPTSESIAPDSVSREAPGSVIRLRGALPGYTYAVVDPETGSIIARQQPVSGGEIAFTGLDVGKTYRVTVKSANVSWQKGVQVYPYSDAFWVDYAHETVKSTASSDGSIPFKVEYRIRGNDAGATWILGGDSAWQGGLGSQPVSLASTLDVLDAIGANATLSYRIRPGWDGYEGASVSPVSALEVPRRPSPPVAGRDYTVDYYTEKIMPDNRCDSLDVAVAGSSGWISLKPGDRWTFVEASWGLGSTAHLFYVRFPAAPGEAKFASSPHHTDTIRARPAAPEGHTYTIVGSVVNINDMKDKSYEYKKVDGSGSEAWRPLVVSDGKSAITSFSIGDIYYIRYAATERLPASFDAIFSTPLIINSVIFTAYSYGKDLGGVKGVAIANFTGAAVDSVIVSLESGQASPFVLTGASTTINANSINSEAWTITPKSSLPAGSYSDRLKMEYDYGEGDKRKHHELTASALLLVNKADWDMSAIAGSVEAQKTTFERLTFAITDAPKNAKLKYDLNGTPTGASDSVPASGEVLQTFTGLTPATAYTLSVKPLGDANHNEPQQATMLATGYTAYATPVFDAVVAEVNYRAEYLTLKSGYSPSDYTVTVSPTGDTVKSPYMLTDLLASLTSPTFRLSLVRNARVSPPYPASAAATSGDIPARPAAPTGVTTVSASSALESDGKIQLSGSFEYRVHGSMIGWSSATGELAVGAGQYDVRRPATDASFASKDTLVRVGGLCYVTFKSNGGLPAPSEQRLSNNSRANRPADPAKAGYTFGGWYTDNGTFAGAWDFDNGVVTQDTTLYAQWTAHAYTVKYCGNGSAGGSTANSLHTYGDSAKLRASGYVRTGYTFTGWNESAGGSGKAYAGEEKVANLTSADGDTVRLDAKWTAHAYTVKYCGNGSTGGSTANSLHTYGDSAKLRANGYVRAGYTFTGWNESAGGSGKSYADEEKVANLTSADGDTVRLYAQWTAHAYISVAFNSNGGSPVDTQAVATGDMAPRPDNPTRAGYTFVGWCSDAELTVFWNFTRPVTKPMTLYAKWSKFSLLESIVINGEAQPVKDTVYYTVPCGDNNAKVEILYTVAAKPNTLYIDASRPFRLDTAITLTDGVQQKRYKLMLEKRFEFDSIVHAQLGGRLLMAVKSPANNGGFVFQQALWYRAGDGKMLGNKFYYGSPSGEVIADTLYVRLQDSTGTWLSSCPYHPVAPNVAAEEAPLAVYPNPVVVGGVVHLKEELLIDHNADLEERYANLHLIDVHGGVVYTGKASELLQGLTMPFTPGIYYIVLDGKAGKKAIQVTVEN